MEVFKPAWLASSAAINSVDVQPGSLRFATGALNGVSIWLVAPLLSPQLEACPEAKAPLFVGKFHEGEVTTVRWCPQGDVLASAGEDKAVVLWRQRNAPTRSTLEFATSEHWSPALMLKGGHTLDITALSWHPSGKYLVSGGKDTRVCVWAAATSAGGTARTVTKPLQTLTEHLSFVESVIWDPLGGSVASFGHDGELLVWEAEGFLAAAIALTRNAQLGGGVECHSSEFDAVQADQQRLGRRFKRGAQPQAESSEPELGLVAEMRDGLFEAGHEVPATRMDWGPAGEVLAACKGIGGDGRFTAALIPRLPPAAIEECIVGHVAAVTAARFFPTPLLLAPSPAAQGAGVSAESAASVAEEPEGRKRPRPSAEDDSGGPPAQLVTALALASADRRLTVWSSAGRDAPLIELRGAFGGPVTDLAWGAAVLPRAEQRGDAAAAAATGCVGAAPFLLACSIDGTVAVILFGRAAGGAPPPLPGGLGESPPSGGLGVVPPLDLAFAGVCRLYGLELGDFSPPPAADAGGHPLLAAAQQPLREEAEGVGGLVTPAAVRQLMAGQQAWLGDAVTRRVKRALRDPLGADAAAAHSAQGDAPDAALGPARLMPAILVRAAAASGPEALAGDSPGGGVATAAAPFAAIAQPPQLPQQARLHTAVLLTQSVVPTGAEANARAVAVEQAQVEGSKRGKRRIAPVLLDALEPLLQPQPELQEAGEGGGGAAPLNSGGVPAPSAGGDGGGIPTVSSSSKAEDRQWARAWSGAPQPQASSSASVAAALARVQLEPWLTSKTLRRRLAQGAAGPIVEGPSYGGLPGY